MNCDECEYFTLQWNSVWCVQNSFWFQILSQYLCLCTFVVCSTWIFIDDLMYLPTALVGSLKENNLSSWYLFCSFFGNWYSLFFFYGLFIHNNMTNLLLDIFFIMIFVCSFHKYGIYTYIILESRWCNFLSYTILLFTWQFLSITSTILRELTINLQWLT